MTATSTQRAPRALGRGPAAMPRLPGLDGLRAVAVLGVCFFHAYVSWLPGGFLGVDVFFVLSGFLITTLLLEERDHRGRVDLKQFYLRRARRLLPALFLVLLVVSAAAVLVYRDMIGQLRTDVPAALGYVSNWWYIVQDQSYVQSVGRPQVLLHLWSLAVEEQFYLLWPVILLAVLAWRGRGRLALLAFGGALLSTALMVGLSLSGGHPLPHDPSPVYYATHTHAMGLMLGAALAAVWAPWRMTRDRQQLTARTLDVFGVVGLAVVLWFFLQVGYATDPFLYRGGGFLLLSAGTALLVASLSHPLTWLGVVLGSQPLRWIGERSYGIYLWHWPVFMVTRPEQDVPFADGPWLLAGRFAITFALAAASYRFVELPIRHGALARWWARTRSARGTAKAGLLAGGFVTCSVVAAAALLVAIALWRGPAPSAAAVVIPNGSRPADAGGRLGPGGVATTTKPRAAHSPHHRTASPGTEHSDSPSPSVSPSPRTATTSPPSSPSTSGQPAWYDRVSTFGDSVMLGAKWALEEELGARVDAVESRQASDLISIVEQSKANHRLRPYVVIHTGTNGTLTSDQLTELLTALKDEKRVVLLNLHVPRQWEADNNAVIADIAPKFPNVVVIDWHSIAERNGSWLYGDRIHLQTAGQKAYAALVRKALEQ